MKLASLKHPKKLDGEPLVVSRDNQSAVSVGSIVSSIREALETWDETAPKLQKVYDDLNAGRAQGSFKVDESKLHSPLPRAFQWADGSAYIQHVKLVRKARNAPLPETLETVPLMYQGAGDTFLAPTEDIPQIADSHGTDFEGEVGVITARVPMGTKANDALKYIRLIVIINDVSLRGLVPADLAQGFGFFHSKPSSSFGPFALTPDELGAAWKDGRIHLPLLSELNGKFFGNPDAGHMHFHFGELIAHAARTRDLGAGTIIGSGTVSNEDPARGSSCLAEKRMLEQINDGKIATPFMRPGDTVKIEMKDSKGANLFGTIFQKVVQASVRE
ncbi:MAG: fumarylacetoacetate hydrolase family protein [Bdellovibrionia bacterium]